MSLGAQIAMKPAFSNTTPFKDREEDNVHLHPLKQEKPSKIWFKEVEAIYKGNSTGKEYSRYNRAFIEWFRQRYGKEETTELAVR